MSHRTSSEPQGSRPPGAIAQFHNNALLAMLLGEQDRNLHRLEEGFGVRLSCRGNRIAIAGPQQQVDTAEAALHHLYKKLERGEMVGSGDVDTVIRLSAPSTGALATELPAIKTKRGAVSARSHGQAGYMEMLQKHEMVFGIGPAGTGKTYLAVAQAVAMLTAGKVEKIVLCRPAVEAGERLGFLPGDMKEKVDPYLRPLYDALNDMLPGEQMTRRIGTGEIEIAPLAFMRGRTLAHSFVILDEAQNTTPAQMKMFLTRMGENTRMVITGDMSQVDLPKGVESGLTDAVATLEGVQGIGVCRLDRRDVVRHPLVARIVEAYEDRQDAR